jgi:hypothetical protein
MYGQNIRLFLVSKTSFQGHTMAITEIVKLNESQGSEFKLPCMKCTGQTVHNVLVSVDVCGDETDGDWSIQWSDDYQIVECAGCKSKSFRNVSSNSEDYHQVGENEWDHSGVCQTSCRDHITLHLQL